MPISTTYKNRQTQKIQMPKGRAEQRSASRANRLGPGSRKATRLTCSNCRSRKIRCDGAQPSCGICVAYGEECQYAHPPPMTQILAMTDKIAQLEQTIKDLQSSTNSAASHHSTQPDTATEASPGVGFTSPPDAPPSVAPSYI